MCKYCFSHVLTIWNVRPAGDSSNGKVDAVDDDRVELEKSNILLMGPTGSGKPVFAFSFSSCVYMFAVPCYDFSLWYWILMYHASVLGIINCSSELDDFR